MPHRNGPHPVVPWIVFVLVLLIPIGWGADASWPWDADNIAPGSVLKAIAQHFGPGWYSSYGPVPYLLTAAAYLPLLAAMRILGELGHASASYPFGFRHPDFAVTLLVVTARLVTLSGAVVIAALAVKGARDAPPSPRGAASAVTPVPGWIALALLAGSPAFVYYSRTSNVDMFALAFAWLAVALVIRPAPRLIHLVAGAIAAALAVCCKEQVAPLSVVAGLVACMRAWRGVPGTKASGASGAAVVAAAALAAYLLVWMLPFNFSGWLEHHRFIFLTAKYPRSFAATAEGFAALGGRCVRLAPVALGWPVLLGLALALLTRASLRGLAVPAWGAMLYLGAFIGSIGYVYPRFLMPALIVALPIACRGYARTIAVLGAPVRGVLGAALAVLILAGGPALDVLMLQDPRLALERWLSSRPAGTRVEVAGNPHFQARVPRRLEWLRTSADSLALQPRGPVGDVVLTSSLDHYEFEQGALRVSYSDVLRDPAVYRLAFESRPPVWGRLAAGLFVSPSVRAYLRVRPGTVP